MKQKAYQMEFTELLEELQTSEAWISSKEAKQRNELYWPNAIQSKDKNSALKIFLEQFLSDISFGALALGVAKLFIFDTPFFSIFYCYFVSVYTLTDFATICSIF